MCVETELESENVKSHCMIILHYLCKCHASSAADNCMEKSVCCVPGKKDYKASSKVPCSKVSFVYLQCSSISNPYALVGKPHSIEFISNNLPSTFTLPHWRLKRILWVCNHILAHSKTKLYPGFASVVNAWAGNEENNEPSN